MPVMDSTANASPAEPAPVVRTIQTDGTDQTPALAMSGVALLVAAGTAGYARRNTRSARAA